MSYPPNYPPVPGDGAPRSPRYDPDGQTQPQPSYPPQGGQWPPQGGYNPPQGGYNPPLGRQLPPDPGYVPPQPPDSQPPNYPPPYYPPPPRSSAPLEYYQPIRPVRKKRRGSNVPWKGGCCALIVLLGAFLCVAGAFLVAAFALSPGKTNILVMGIDRVDTAANGGDIGRSDSIVMAQVDPAAPRIATLAIPRDLWVKIPGVGDNRINTAHFFAEANQPGTGPAALAQTIQDNFGISSTEYVRIHLEGVPALVDAMGGVTINLTEATALYPVGVHQLNGTEALAFIRDRKNTDDFFRMAHGEIFIKAAAQQMLNPLTWLRLPAILATLPQAMDTNIPTSHLPALALALLRVGPGNIDSHTLPREDTQPFTTDAGAQVLLPKWDLINPLVKQIFGN